MTRLDAMRAAAEEVLSTLRRAGHEAYFAGGSVRDIVMGLEPHDFDVATSARPEQVTALFERTVEVGASFGVVVVLLGGFETEVATFRSDGAYIDGRHPESVTFGSAAEDVARRDFTINGLLLDPTEGRIIDHVGGRADIAAGVVRCIGGPAARFSEDRLRMLRAVRFAVRFGFEVEPDTWAALREGASGIGAVSAERIRDELLRMLTGPRPDQALRLLHRSGLLAEVLPEVAALEGVAQPPDLHPEGDVLEHTVRALAALEVPGVEPAPSPDPLPGDETSRAGGVEPLPGDETSRAGGVEPRERAQWEVEALLLATLLHDLGKPVVQELGDRIRFHGHEQEGARMAEDVCRRLRLSTRHRRRVRDLVADHMRLLQVEHMRPARRLRLFRREHFPDLLALHRADRLAASGDLSQYDYCLAELARLGPQRLRPPRLLDGNDLRALGVEPGPAMGVLLHALEDAQLEGSVRSREEAERWLLEQLEARRGPAMEEG